MENVNRRQELLFKQICERILDGAGSGHCSAFQPWLQLRRKNASKESNQVRGWIVPLGRTATYMSRGEYRTALLLLWLKIADLREQYPIWPTAHPHPLEGAELAPSNLKPSRGLLAIASESGINHEKEIGTKIPYIATIDFAATVVIDGIARLFLFALKPIAHRDQAVEWKTAGRLELERRYSEEIEATYKVIYSGIVSDELAANLDKWAVHSDLSEHPHLRASIQRFNDAMNVNHGLSIRESIAKAADDCGLEPSDAWVLHNYCAWHQIIDIDPRKELLHSYPAPQGGRAFRQKLREQFFGWV